VRNIETETGTKRGETTGSTTLSELVIGGSGLQGRHGCVSERAGSGLGFYGSGFKISVYGHLIRFHNLIDSVRRWLQFPHFEGGCGYV